MPNTEDIEAKLCAYVDGALDETGRGEIERHLTTNPQHRKLIEELIEQRWMLRALPRARAPHDVAETLNAQLERAALLNQDEDWRDQPIRLSRWPQVRAAAAVLLLVFGLAAVVYYVVPSPNRTGGPIVFNAPTIRDDRAADSLTSRATTNPIGVPGPAVIVSTGKPDPFMSAATPEPLRDPVVNNALGPHLNMLPGAFASAEPKRAAVQVVVAAANAEDAQRRVQDYFNERGVELKQQFAQAPMPQALSIGPSQRAFGSRQQQPAAVTVQEQVKEKDLAQPAPAPDGPLAPADVNAELQEQGVEQTFVARLPRREVAELSRGITNQLAGRTVQVSEEIASEPPRSESSEFQPVEIGNWSSLFPWLAKSQFGGAAHERRFAFMAPTTQPDADEEVDVLIVVRPDAALQLQQGQQALTDHAAGGSERESAPTTAPATGPSSP